MHGKGSRRRDPGIAILQFRIRLFSRSSKFIRFYVFGQLQTLNTDTDTDTFIF